MANPFQDLSVLLQFAKFSKGFRISDFYDFIEEHIGIEKLDCFGRLAYPNQWQMRLKDREIRERLIRIGRTRIKNRSCWMYPLNQDEIRGFVHWLPITVTNDQLKEHLKLYGIVLFVESEERSIKGRNIESGQRYFGLCLPHGTIKEDLPHFLKINSFMCNVVVRGREPACYHCREVGHRRVECPKYKEKLSSYCSRDPNTAPKRLRPRGKRHVKSETEVRAETGKNEVSSSGDIACLERRDLVAELITEPQLSASDVQEEVIVSHGEAAASTEKGLEKTDVLSQNKASSHIDSSAALFSETPTANILETIQHIQQRTTEGLQQTFKIFENEIALTFTRGVLSFHTRDQITATEATGKNFEQEMRNKELETQAKEVYASEESTTVDMAGRDFSANIGIKETKGPEKESELSMQQMKAGTSETEEKVYKKLEEITKQLQSAAKDSTSSPDTISSSFQILEKTKQGAEEIIQNTFKQLGELTLSLKALEKPSHESVSDADSGPTKSDSQEILGRLKKVKKLAIKYSQETSKKIEAHLTSQLSGESIDTEAKLTEDDIRAAKQILAKTEEKATEIFQKTIERLEKYVDLSKQSPTITERAHDSKTLPKIANITTQPYVTMEQVKQGIASALKNISKDGIGITDETEKATSLQSEETVQIEWDPMTVVQGSFEGTEMCEDGGEKLKMKTTETASQMEGMKVNVSKRVQEDIDKLQTNIKKIFASVQDKAELDPETITMLKQMESEVIEKAEETKAKWEKDI